MTYSPKASWVLTGLALAIAFGGPALLRLTHLDITSRTALVIAMLVLGCGLAWWALFYRDEIQRRDGLLAFFWGGQAGLFMAAVTVLVLRANGGVTQLADTLLGRPPQNPNGYFALGFFLPIAMQLAGILIAAAILKLQKSGRA